MNRIEKEIWGRTLPLEISYDCLDDEEVSTSQEQALAGILEHWSGIDSSLDAVKAYCAEHSSGLVRAGDIDNIFKYVKPESLFIVREPESTVALMCGFRFDVEHGLAVVFKDGKLDRIGSQDSVM